MTVPMQHFQMRMNNSTQAQTFYASVFGWTFETSPSSDTILEIKQGTEVIGELVQPPLGKSPGILPFFKVNNKNDARDAAVQEGGSEEDSAISSSIKSVYAILNDRGGCTFGVFQ
jgi:predicted enzyme related to lactoylglutathione lyase